MPRAKGSPHKIDLVGMVFGEWTVLRRVVGSTWLCRCSCGNEGTPTTSGLKLGKSKSCGCKGKDWCTTHGYSKTPEYLAWTSMHQRCSNPKNKWFHRYGGRGISVCDRWQSFENFYADMGPRPLRGTLDRYPDNDGNYEPSNCRWATQKQQIRNREKTVFLEYEGVTRSLAEWAELYGIKRKVLANRIKQGWSVFDALTKPKSGRWGAIRSKPIQD